MAIFDSAIELASHLDAKGVDCRIEQDFVILPDSQSGLTATIRFYGGWLVFKAFISDWQPKEPSVASANLLLVQDRLIGFRFSVTDDGLCALQDLPIEVLNEEFHHYIAHIFHVLVAILPTLQSHFDSGHSMSDDDIDAMFELMDARCTVGR
jgi:hypothetical protein